MVRCHRLCSILCVVYTVNSRISEAINAVSSIQAYLDAGQFSVIPCKQVYKLLYPRDIRLVPKNLLIFCAFAFRAFQFVICLSVRVAAFRRGAFPAFPPIKHGKHQKQRAVFLMCADPAVPVECTVAEMVTLVMSATTRSVSLFAS